MAVEAELVTCTRYVEFSEKNFSCYSNEFAKIILLAASEVDSIHRDICAILAPSEKAGTISEYYPILTKEFPELCSCQVEISRYMIRVQPWRGWTDAQRPPWWSKGYNKLKHQRLAHLSSASLESALNAVAAQFLALQLFHYVHNAEWVEIDLSLRSALFGPPTTGLGGTFWGYGNPFSHLMKP